MTNVTIPFKGKLHRFVEDALRTRKRMWNNASSDRRRKWARDIENHQAFIHESDDDRNRKSKMDETGVKEYTQVEIPYSYGLVMAFHTYLSSVFLARSPVLQFQERHGARETSVQALEAVMDYQTSVGGHLVPYYIWLMDATKHGIGVMGQFWQDEIIRTSQIVEEVPSFGGIALPGARPKKVKRTVELPGYKGMRKYNVRPHDFIFDTRVSVANFQTGEFCGRILDMSWLDITDGAEKGIYMNIDALKRTARHGTTSFDEHRDADEQVIDLPDRADNHFFGSESGEFDIPQTDRLEGYEMFVRLVPFNWQLGKSKTTEKWVFTVINDVIIGARPFGELHDKYPYSVIETEIDGYALFKRSMMEIAEPLNEVLSWLINTHFFNIRKSLNDSFVADPSRVIMKDFKNPEYGLAIRMRPEAYGQPIGNFVQQFKVGTVTQTHMNDTKIITELMQQTLGINTQLMGMLQEGGRRTATEVRGATGFSMNRLKTQAEYISAMGFAPDAMMSVQSTQQHLDIERYYRMTGDLLPASDPMVLVTPESISGFWDYVPVDGTMPVDKLALANLWKEIMMGVGQNEMLMQSYDIGKIFAYTAQLSGAKNIARFKVQLTPDDEIAKQRAAGNIVPAGELASGTRVSEEAFARSPAAESGRIEDTVARINEPKQLSGIGPLS